jgi:hypothetical protein
MFLRDHPLISYRGFPSWPPAWTWIDGEEDKHPTGEIGILRTTLLSKIQPANRCFLLISYEGASYMGCLLFDDYVFCDQVTKRHCNLRLPIETNPQARLPRTGASASMVP